MGTDGVRTEVTSKELLKLARAIERRAAQRRKLLADIAELEGRIREARRMFRQLAEQLGVDQVREQLTADIGDLSCCLPRAQDAGAPHAADCARMQ